MLQKKTLLFSRRRGIGFLESILAESQRLESLHRYRTSQTYLSAYRSFSSFLGSDIDVTDIDGIVMCSYQSWLLGRGVSMNTVSFYMRILRAVFNRVSDRDCSGAVNPFINVYTGVAATVKRAISVADLRRIARLDLAGRPSLCFARDLFLFSFYCRGISFIDIAFMKKKNLSHGFLNYRRRKTGVVLSVKWEEPMQIIVDRYSDSGSEYLFPILGQGSGGAVWKRYRSSLKNINNGLKAVARMAGLDINLTTYVARHSWASVARNCNVPVAVISGGMGHRSETTTMIYLASIDSAAIDRANILVMNMIDESDSAV